MSLPRGEFAAEAGVYFFRVDFYLPELSSWRDLI
jgi:hypothetical protein